MQSLLCFLALSTGVESQVIADPPAINFGNQPQLRELDGVVTLRNTGTTPVSLGSVVFECFCAAGELQLRSLKPGETTTLRFKFKTLNFEGQVNKNITIFYQPGSESRLVVPVAVFVVPPWSTSVSELHLGGLRAGTATETDFEVHATESTSFTPTVQCRAGWLTVDIRKSLDSSRTWHVRLIARVPADQKSGEMRAEVLILSNDPVKPSAAIPVTLVVESDLLVSPRTLHFGRVERRAGSQAKVVLHSDAGRKFSILETVYDEALKTRITPGVAANRHEIDVVLLPGGRGSSYLGQIIVRTDHPESREFIIPVRALWKDTPQ